MSGWQLLQRTTTWFKVSRFSLCHSHFTPVEQEFIWMEMGPGPTPIHSNLFISFISFRLIFFVSAIKSKRKEMRSIIFQFNFRVFSPKSLSPKKPGFWLIRLNLTKINEISLHISIFSFPFFRYSNAIQAIWVLYWIIS